MKKTIIALAGLALVLTAVKAQAVHLDWQGTKCVTIDNTFKVCKPNNNWDTQRTADDDRPVKWVYHKKDVNPVIRLNYDENVSGQTAHDYAKALKPKLSQRGIKIKSTTDTVINGRNVSLITGSNEENQLTYYIGVWRNAAKGFFLECTANKGEFSNFKSQCQQAMNSVKIVSEGK